MSMIERVGPAPPAQLVLDVRLPEQASFASYFPGRNAEVLAHLHAAAEGREGGLFVWGTAGTGRSHLLQAACRHTAERGRRAAYLPMGCLVVRGPGITEGLEGMDLVCVDDIQLVAGWRDWQEALFHLHNRLLATQGSFVAAGDSPPAALPIQLADLRSRLQGGLVLRLQELGDDERVHALQHGARMRGLLMTEEVCRFLLSRCPRDNVSLFGLLDRLDRAALEEGRRLTLPFVKSVLMRQEGGRAASP
jgi:DnaA family protein